MKLESTDDQTFRFHKAKRLAKINHASIKSFEHYASQVAALAAVTPNSAPTTLNSPRGAHLPNNKAGHLLNFHRCTVRLPELTKILSILLLIST